MIMLIKILLLLILILTIFLAFKLNKVLVKKSYVNKSANLKSNLRYDLLLLSDIVELKNLDKKNFDRSVFKNTNLKSQVELIHNLKSYITSKHYIDIYARVSDELKRLNESNNHIN